jgi:WD40 repeat protein
MIYCGSYSHLLFGINADMAEQKLSQEFLHKTHTEMISCISTSRNLLATGSSDSNIFLFKTTTKKEVGVLSRHTATITALAFYENKHLLSASMDGTIMVWRVKVTLERIDRISCFLFVFLFFFFQGLGVSVSDQSPCQRSEESGVASDGSDGAEFG